MQHIKTIKSKIAQKSIAQHQVDGIKFSTIQMDKIKNRSICNLQMPEMRGRRRRWEGDAGDAGGCRVRRFGDGGDGFVFQGKRNMRVSREIIQSVIFFRGLGLMGESEGRTESDVKISLTNTQISDRVRTTSDQTQSERNQTAPQTRLRK